MSGAFGDGGGVAFALTTGVITAFNPCGFAMLPAYVSYFIGSNADDVPATRSARVTRAGLMGGVVTLGFVTVFGIVGLVAAGLRSSVTRSAPYVAMIVGVALVVLAIAMLRGLEIRVPFLKVKSLRTGAGFRSMYVYGVSYAVVSLGCALPGFLANVAFAFHEQSVVRSLVLYIAFAAGMGLVLLALSIFVALAQSAAVRGMRRASQYTHRASGVLLLLAGLYIARYGYFEYRLLIRNDDVSSRTVDAATGISGRIQNALDGIGSTWFALAVGVVAAVLVVSAVQSRRSGREHP
jgi:cytochrome c biogenesis protein CcdA